jgi:hypothetical protein
MQISQTARRLHADDFELIYPRGGTLSKEEYLRRIASGDLDYLEWEPGEIRVRMYRDSAVIRYQARLRVSVNRSPGRPVKFWHSMFTRSETVSGKLSGPMPPRSKSNEARFAEARLTMAAERGHAACHLSVKARRVCSRRALGIRAMKVCRTRNLATALALALVLCAAPARADDGAFNHVTVVDVVEGRLLLDQACASLAHASST